MSKKGEGSLSWLRDRNRQRVLDVLRIRGRTSQADIARATGLPVYHPVQVLDHAYALADSRRRG